MLAGPLDPNAPAWVSAAFAQGMPKKIAGLAHLLKSCRELVNDVELDHVIGRN